MTTIRLAKLKDLNNIYLIFKEITKTGDTHIYPNTITKDEVKKAWFNLNTKTYVVTYENIIVGTYILRPNHLGLGSHIANSAYMLSPKYQGKGIGKKMCLHSLKEAKRLNYIATQFNIVVSTNVKAIQLWKKFGFTIIGTVPNGFKHKTLGYVDTHIMYKRL